MLLRWSIYWLIVFCARCASCALDVSVSNICARFAQDALPMCNICARLYLFPQCSIYEQDLHKIVLISPMRNICTRFVQDCTFFLAIYVQDLSKIVLISPMHKICAKLYFFPQCTIYVQDLRKIVYIFPMCNICTRLYTYFSNVQDSRKMVLISPMRNICTRFVQDCISFSHAQYMCKICARLYFSPQCEKFAGIIGRNMSHITYLL